jgi:putative IMPACT (imprinted ancient) family translation regulator
MVTLGISFGYECESQIRNQIMRHDGEIEITDYKDKINLKVTLPKLQFDNFVNICKNLCRGEIIIDIKNEPHLP